MPDNRIVDFVGFFAHDERDKACDMSIVRGVTFDGEPIVLDKNYQPNRLSELPPAPLSNIIQVTTVDEILRNRGSF